ncbi:MAG TPA: hypothetical protein VGQ22_00420 [Steroidobacteraceae bacterium]|jgi:hypothetical protein|nr:hypothetical protein [Steroidobacteraceae bacterium]
MTRVVQSRVLLFAVACLALPSPMLAHDGGEHDFDFNFGVWRTRVTRLERPLSGSQRWLEYQGIATVRKVWSGRASLFELDVQGAAGRIEGMGLRLYDPRSQQWNLNWASAADGALTPPMIGRFAQGHGEFLDHELFDGRGILARNSFSDITPTSARFQQAFSTDGGRSWETNWVMTFAATADRPAPAAEPSAAAHEDGREFDFDIGTWTLHASRLQEPLTGSTRWEELDGTVVVSPVWGGRANLAEVTTTGPSGRLEILSLRLYDPRSRQWSLSFADSAHGELSVPMFGQFQNGRGEFYSQEPYRGRMILVRFVIVPLTRDSARSEQAFSQDGGKTWEVNWVNTYTRTGAKSGRAAP